MSQLFPDTLGKAVFVTHDGLTAEGCGRLSSIADNFTVVEFRDAHGNVSHLPPEGDLAFFGTVIFIDNQKVTLIGAVTRASDAMGRPGFLGVCFAIETGNFDQSHVDAIIPFLKAARNHHETTFRHKRHTDHIGLLQPDPNTHYELLPVTRDQSFETYIRGTESSEHDAVFRLWNLVEEIEQPILLWNRKEGQYATLNDQLAEQLVQDARHAREMRASEEQEQARLIQQHIAQSETEFPEGEGFEHRATERQVRFDQRSTRLKYPRPNGISVDHEDYLIGLIQFVVEQSSGYEHLESQKELEIHAKTDFQINSVFTQKKVSRTLIPEFIYENKSTAVAVGVISILLTVLLFTIITIARPDVTQNNSSGTEISN